MPYTIKNVREAINDTTKIDSPGQPNQYRMSKLKPETFAREDGLADQVVRALGKDGLKPTQLRKIFHALKEIQQEIQKEMKKDPEMKFNEFNKTKLLQLAPQLAYATGRKLIPQDFYLLLRECLDPERMEHNKDFLRAFEFIEAILAYHKYRSLFGEDKTEPRQRDSG